MVKKAHQELDSQITGQIDRLLPEITSIRHDLHAHPQLAYTETYASQLIQQHLTDANVPFQAGLAETGVVAAIRCDHHDPQAQAIALRADIDALPITENTNLPYASQNPGLMHACGHDGHTAALLGAAEILASLAREHPEALPKPIKLIFQPAEEAGAGAKRMIEDGALDQTTLDLPVERIYGLHGWSSLDVGQIRTLPGPMMAATLSFQIELRGQGGHAAAPHETIDPIPAAANLVSNLQTIASRFTKPTTPVVLTIANLHAGEGAVNIIPHTATLNGTVRTFDLDLRDQIRLKMQQIIEHTAAAHACTASLTTVDGYPPTINDPEATQTLIDTAADAFGPDHVALLDDPVMGAEDFSFYAQRIPACFAFVGLRPPGQDTYPGLHTPEFDFNDHALPVSMKLLCELGLRGG
ncbi:M20 metallopeptidase family protein [Mucisphaera sp.]|uniref:M20 metallopeptidase family protein n=1 Tax=Mucisphaera sp. TaxID=2913024 RepID=UPI003D12A665